MEGLTLFTVRYAKFTYLGHIPTTPNSRYEEMNLIAPNPYNLPLTYNKKYKIKDKNNIGFAILDDRGIRREFNWNAEHFKFSIR